MNGSPYFKLLFTIHAKRSISIARAMHPLECRLYSDTSTTSPARETRMDRAARDSLKTEHSKFIAEAHQTKGWIDSDGSPGKLESKSREGRLLPTSSHLFKLVLPLPGLRPAEKNGPAAPLERPPPTVFLLHPSQPLSHIARLIQASLPSPTDGPQPYTPRLPTVSFQNLEDDDNTGHQSPHQWADSTDIGDFVKEAVHSQEFTIVITPDKASNTAQLAYNDEQPPSSASSGTTPVHNKEDSNAFAPLEIPVSVPSFDERTRFLRRRRERLQKELKGMQDIKDMCDTAARKGARRLATGGFLILLTYWIAVLRLTFFTHLGWDFMEPVTYLTEFLAIMGGYAWFLRQGREISYTSILNQSVSTRRRALYTSKGLDIERWAELVTEEKAINREIEKIREDYEGGWKEGKKAKVEVEKAKPSAADEPEVKEGVKEPATETHPGDALLDEALLKEKAANGKADPAEERAVEIKREKIVAEDEKATSSGTVPSRGS
ncbi:hypothetical protein FRB95_010288 [Tulasnella sp. JGI-2019a]|nr:hypothetical protein FRB95_010288 [Tulasnella sp. JGI-2019a]